MENAAERTKTAVEIENERRMQNTGWERVDYEERLDDSELDEPICATHESSTDRFQVPGGWIYRTKIYVDGGPGSVAMVFVPDTSRVSRT
jgi:hypothetical protein